MSLTINVAHNKARDLFYSDFCTVIISGVDNNQSGYHTEEGAADKYSETTALEPYTLPDGYHTGESTMGEIWIYDEHGKHCEIEPVKNGIMVISTTRALELAPGSGENE